MPDPLPSTVAKMVDEMRKRTSHGPQMLRPVDAARVADSMVEERVSELRHKIADLPTQMMVHQYRPMVLAVLDMKADHG